MATLGRLQTLRVAPASVVPIDAKIGTLCVKALLGFRSAQRHRIPWRDHS
jgi:hypothetical protein